MEELEQIEGTISVEQFLVDDKVFTGVHNPCRVHCIVRDDKGKIKWITFKYPGDNYKTLSPYEARNYYKKL